LPAPTQQVTIINTGSERRIEKDKNKKKEKKEEKKEEKKRKTIVQWL